MSKYARSLLGSMRTQRAASVGCQIIGMGFLTFWFPHVAADTATSDHPPCEEAFRKSPVLVSPIITVLSVNLAHGRKDGLNQMLQSGDKARENIRHVSKVLKSLDADIVALQEADGPSRWSGGFDHVKTVADAADYGCSHHGLHASNRMYQFGTALLSRVAFTRAETFEFEPTPPTTRKGFVTAQVLWQPEEQVDTTLELTLASVHLDFFRQGRRERQFAELADALGQIPKPLIVMGDFNTEWVESRALLKQFADRLGLKAYRPEAGELGTYGEGKKRLDWILISNDLMFTKYSVVAQVVSDHQPVLASICPVATCSEVPDTRVGWP